MPRFLHGHQELKLVLKDGQVEEIGTHQELMVNDKLYAELFNLQAAGYQ